MDMSKYSTTDGSNFRLLQHTKGIRENQVSVALMMLYLAGYEVEIKDTGFPRADAAREALNELNNEAIPIWSCATNAGGVWERWQRDALKYGDLEATSAWRIWCERTHRPATAMWKAILP